MSETKLARPTMGDHEDAERRRLAYADFPGVRLTGETTEGEPDTPAPPSEPPPEEPKPDDGDEDAG